MHRQYVFPALSVWSGGLRNIGTLPQTMATKPHSDISMMT